MRGPLRVWLLGGAVATMIISALLTTWAGSPASAGRSTASGGDPGLEAISVRGEWKLVVRGRDGAVIEERDFSNHLTAPGSALLGRILAGQMVSGVWNVQLWSVGDEAQLCHTSAADVSPVVCSISSPSFSPLAGSRPQLDVRLGTGGYSGAVVLTGTVVADRDGTVERVVTQNFGCPASVGSAQCAADVAASSRSGVGADFTETAIEPLEVRAGQEVDVTVAISFS